MAAISVFDGINGQLSVNCPYFEISPHPAWLCGLISTKETETTIELPLFHLPDESTETETLVMPEREWSAMS